MTNGEKFKAVTEREQGFLSFCNKHNDDGSCVKCPLNNKARKRLGCAYAWLDLEVKEEKPMRCPYCGEECERGEPGDGMVVIVCTICGYRSGGYYYCESEAIAAHNRVCKSVAAYKESEV